MTTLFTSIPNDFFNFPKRQEDPSDLRIGHHIERASADFETNLSEIAAGDVVLWGYPDDRGVERNFGRTGALLAPDIIRKQLYKMTPPHGSRELPRIFDFGNLKTWSHDLPEAHAFARECVLAVQKKGAKLVTLGGGHDWAFPDFVDFAGHNPAVKSKIINVDAHLDMRPNPKQEDRQSHSGTPFRRIIEENNSQSLSMSTIGLQKHCNNSEHVEWAHSRRVTTLFLEDMPESLNESWPLVSDRLELQQDQNIGLSIDMDAFPQHIAPGVSAPQVYGINPQICSKLIQNFRTPISQLGIYEYNPSFDLDERTARLAALFIYQYLTRS